MESGFLVAVAQIKSQPTRLEENKRKIFSSIDSALSQHAELVTFPELTIPGYGCLDVFQDQSFIRANLAVRDEVVAYSKGKPVTVLVGFVDQGGSAREIYNSVAAIRDGKLLAIVDKTLLPDYDVFWERRYFRPARKIEPITVSGRKLGIEICEDLWDTNYSTKVSNELAEKGAEIIINLSASPFSPGQLQHRVDLINGVVSKRKLPFVYTNLVGGQDGYEGELVFDGRSLVVNSSGQLVALAKGFEEDLLIVDPFNAAPRDFTAPDRIEEIYYALVLGIRDYFSRNNFKRAYIGLSGGIDSALVAALAVEALGKPNVIGVTMPSHITSSETKNDALKIAANLGIACQIRPIVEQYQAWAKDAEKSQSADLGNITKQNVQARLRGLILMEYSNQDPQGIVITTGNKTELALGYCTLYGDMCGGLAAISDVSKEMVYDLSRYLNQKTAKEIIPQSIINRPPTAELEQGQTDEANLPGPYSVISPLVDQIVEAGCCKEELYKKYPKEVVDRTYRLLHISEYKRRQAAPGIRVSGKAFGAGRRVPIDNRH